MACRPASSIRFIGLPFRQRDHHLVARGSIGRNPGVMDTGTVDGVADLVHIRLLGKPDVNQRAALEIDAQVDVVPEQHGKNARHAEDQRETEEVPLLPQPIDIYFVRNSSTRLLRSLLLVAVSRGCPRSRFWDLESSGPHLSRGLHYPMESASPRCLRLRIESKITRETKTAVNRLAAKPKLKVTAKPLTGPVPKRNRIRAETIVVT